MAVLNSSNDVFFPEFDNPFSLDNCQQERMLSTLIVDWSFKCIYRCNWRAVPGRHDSSEWLKWQTLMLPCLNMTSQSQLTIPNMGANCLPLLDDWSFKCLHDAVDELFQGCGRKIPRQIFLPISNWNTPCNRWPRGTGSRGMEACIFLPNGLKDVRGDFKIVVGWLKGGGGGHE